MLDKDLTPFFILGNPRSGTTLLRLMLDSHEKITVPPECGFLIWFYEKYKFIKFTNAQDIEYFVADLKTAKKIESWNLDYIELTNYLLENNPVDYASLIDMVYRFYSRSINKVSDIWGDKNNFYIYHVEELVNIYPKAKFIHLIRDGRDVACSYRELNSKKIISKFAPKLPVGIKEIAAQWHDNNQNLLKDLKVFVASGSHIQVKYENLVLQPEIQLREISGFLGLEFKQDMLNYYEKSKSYEPEEFFQWKSNTKKPLQTDGLNRYKKDMTQHEIIEFNIIAEETLRTFNYDI